MPSVADHRVSIDLSDLQTENYSGYFLFDNPFPGIPVTEEIPPLNVDRDELMKDIGDVIKEAFNSGKSQTFVIQGLAGNGKSHTLKFVKNEINRQLTTRTGRKAVAVYVENPGAEFQHFVTKIIDDLGLDFLRDLAYKIIAQQLTSDELITFLRDSAAKKQLSSFASSSGVLPSDIPKILATDHYEVLDMFGEVVKRLRSTVQFDDFATAILMLCYPLPAEKAAIASNWLLGGKLNKNDLETIRVTQEIADGSNGLRAFFALRMLLDMTDFKMLYILLDEFEQLRSYHATRQNRYYDFMRNWIDQNTTGFCLIACVTPGGWSEMYDAGHPVIRRLLGNVAWLESFDVPRIEQLIGAYLQAGRQTFFKKNPHGAEDFQRTVRKYKNAKLETFPFELPAVKAVYKMAKGNIGDTLSLCRRLLMKGRDKGFVLIDSEKKVADFLGPPGEP